MLEEGFLLANPFFLCFLQKSGLDRNRAVISVARKILLEYLPMSDDPTEEEMMKGPQIDRETPRKGLLLMRYSEEEADRIIDEMERYDSYFAAGEPEWLDNAKVMWVSLQQIRENCMPLYAMLSAQGLVREDAETQAIYEIGPGSVGAFTEWYTDENLETLKAVVALSLYDYAKTYLSLEAFTGGTYAAEGEAAKLKKINELRNLAFISANQAYVTHFCPEEKWGSRSTFSRNSVKPCGRGSRPANG